MKFGQKEHQDSKHIMEQIQFRITVQNTKGSSEKPVSLMNLSLDSTGFTRVSSKFTQSFCIDLTNKFFLCFVGNPIFQPLSY